MLKNSKNGSFVHICKKFERNFLNLKWKRSIATMQLIINIISATYCLTANATKKKKEKETRWKFIIVFGVFYFFNKKNK